MARKAATVETLRHNLRLPVALFRRLEREAKRSGLTVNAEMVVRLESSFDRAQQDTLASRLQSTMRAMQKLQDTIQGRDPWQPVVESEEYLRSAIEQTREHLEKARALEAEAESTGKAALIEMVRDRRRAYEQRIPVLEQRLERLLNPTADPDQDD